MPLACGAGAGTAEGSGSLSGQPGLTSLPPAEGSDTADEPTGGSTGVPGATTGGDTTGDPDPTTTLGPTSEPPGTSDTGFEDYGCKRVDFLFVIDNSQTMEDEQSALAAAFPQFIQTIQATLTTANDYHIIVVDTDAETRCTAVECGGNNTHDTCDKYACELEQFVACDTVLGAGVVHPAGVEASDELCKPYDTPRWLTHDDPDLTGRFACMARVGTAGAPNERPLDAMSAALQPAINGPGGCNAGFLRDDAILVVTFFSDDPNVEDSHTPVQAHAAVLAAKGGDATKVSVLGLIPMQPNCTPQEKPQAGAHWLEFIGLFGARGKAAPICAADFNEFFAQSIGIIQESCALQPPA
jgi:hypothetical protein